MCVPLGLRCPRCSPHPQAALQGRGKAEFSTAGSKDKTGGTKSAVWDSARKRRGRTVGSIYLEVEAKQTRHR